MTRPPDLNLFQRLLFLALQRLRTPSLHLFKRIIYRQHDRDRVRHNSKQRDSRDSAELLDSGICGIVCDGGKESAGGNSSDHESLLLLLLKQT